MGVNLDSISTESILGRVACRSQKLTSFLAYNYLLIIISTPLIPVTCNLLEDFIPSLQLHMFVPISLCHPICLSVWCHLPPCPPRLFPGHLSVESSLWKSTPPSIPPLPSLPLSLNPKHDKMLLLCSLSWHTLGRNSLHLLSEFPYLIRSLTYQDNVRTYCVLAVIFQTKKTAKGENLGCSLSTLFFSSCQ